MSILTPEDFNAPTWAVPQPAFGCWLGRYYRLYCGYNSLSEFAQSLRTTKEELEEVLQGIREPTRAILNVMGMAPVEMEEKQETYIIYEKERTDDIVIYCYKEHIQVIKKTGYISNDKSTKTGYIDT